VIARKVGNNQSLFFIELKTKYNCFYAGRSLNQFAIRNSQFAITFCDGDFTPTQNVLPVEAGELNPKTLLN